MPKTSSVRSAVSTDLRLLTDTDGHGAMAYIALAYKASRGKIVCTI